MKKLVREPLAQFLVVGALLFLLHHFFSGDGTPVESPPDRVIRLTAAQGRHLAAAFERAWQRPPTPAEWMGLVEAQVIDEVYYREALRLGLDRDDAVVRRRLRQRVEMLSEDVSTLREPGDEELQNYLLAQRENFRLEPRVTFKQVFLDPDRRGASLPDDASRLLRLLNSDEGASVELVELGDPIMLAAAFKDRSTNDVARLFGSGFAASLLGLPLGAWTGPVESHYGSHLVHLEKRVDARDPGLDEVREAVAREWRAEERRKASEAYFESLRQQYTVIIEPGATNGVEHAP